jgi:hypothetical protein
MFTKLLLLAFIAVSGTQQTTAPDPPDDYQPDQTVPRNTHFCCTSVDLQNATGEGCVVIGEGTINACQNVLSCAGNWGKQDGKVVCL